jgi:prophage regulatory protein
MSDSHHDDIELQTLEEVIAAVRLGKTAIYRRIKNGTFPRPVKHSSARVCWIKEEVQQWLRALADARAPRQHAA